MLRNNGGLRKKNGNLRKKTSLNPTKQSSKTSLTLKVVLFFNIVQVNVT
jgi:hypothetical protein